MGADPPLAVSTPLVLLGAGAVRAATGRALGPVGPVRVGADRVTAFEAATGRASRPGAPGPVAVPSALPPAVPELLLLSLVNDVLPRLVDVRGFAMGVNYGTGPVRFPATLPVGAAFVGRLLIVDVVDVPGGLQATYRVTLTAVDTGRDVCVADSLARYLS